MRENRSELSGTAAAFWAVLAMEAKMRKRALRVNAAPITVGLGIGRGARLV